MLQGETSNTNYEFIELKSTSGGQESTDGLTILIIDTAGGNVGRVNEAWPLDGFATGSNGLLLLGNRYDAPDRGPWGNAAENATNFADPPGMGDGDIGPNNAITILLVRDFSGSKDQDLDTSNNGTFNITPWSAIVDSVGLNERGRNSTYAEANLTQANFNPDNVSRIEGNLTPNSTDAWYGGDIAGTLPHDIAYSDDSTFGPFKGKATPGQRNQANTAELADLLISEVNVNPSGFDSFYEYIELMSASGEAVVTDGFHLVLVNTKMADDAPFNLRGSIREAWSLSGFSTGANGLVLIGDDYQTDQPWGNFVDPLTSLRDPDGFGPGDVGADDGFTLLLVSGFTGTIGQDLDSDDDGTLNEELPWEKVHDSVGFGQVGTEILSYAAQFGGDLTQAYHPDNVSRKLGNTTPNSSDAWYGGDYGGEAGGQNSTTISYNNSFFGGFRGGATPGRVNLDSEATQRPDSAILLSEVSVNPPDIFNQQDNKWEDGQEFIELISTSGGIDNLNGLHVLIVDDARHVREAWDLSALSTGTNGLLVIGDSLDDFNLHPGWLQTVFRTRE